MTLNEDCESHYALEYLLEQERLMDAVQPLEKTDKELLDHFRGVWVCACVPVRGRKKEMRLNV